MKAKIILSLILVLLGFSSVEVKAIGDKEIIIQCPDGDKYKCYEIQGATIYKGSGETKIIQAIG